MCLGQAYLYECEETIAAEICSAGVYLDDNTQQTGTVYIFGPFKEK